MKTSCTSLSAMTRRDFLVRAGLGAAAGCLAAPALTAAATAPAKFEIAGFEKHFFEKYRPDEIAQTYDEIDLHLEITVRPDGHIKPEHAADELPVVAAALARRNRRILMVAASIVRPDDPHTEQVLRTAQKLGIRQYRHRGFSYKAGKSIKQQIADFRSQLRELAAMNKAIGIQGLYQNHAGAAAVGAAVWDLDQILDDIEPRYFGLALDTRHLLVELGQAWPTAIQLVAPRIAALYVKSFRWDHSRPIETPLRDGIVTKAMIDRILAGRGSLPVCLHVEHLKLQPVEFAQRAATVAAFRDDARVLRGWLAMA